jgi:hypothetical protein
MRAFTTKDTKDTKKSPWDLDAAVMDAHPEVCR